MSKLAKPKNWWLQNLQIFDTRQTRGVNTEFDFCFLIWFVCLFVFLICYNKVGGFKDHNDQ